LETEIHRRIVLAQNVFAHGFAHKRVSEGLRGPEVSCPRLADRKL
jgi:hypothetical protein